MNETPASAARASRRQPRVRLFATCLIDIIRPKTGFPAVKLLEDAGCTAVVPAQTCRGRRSGDGHDAGAAGDQGGGRPCPGHRRLEQTLLLGMHGHRRLHILVAG
jgi:hypothetical protein